VTSKYIDYVNGERYTVTIPSTMKSRVVYYSGTTIVGSGKWKNGTQTYSNSQGSNKVRIMVAYVSDTDITDVNDFVGNVIIKFASSIHATLQSEISGAAADAKKTGDEIGDLKSAINKEAKVTRDYTGFLTNPDFELGVINISTGQIESSTNRVTSKYIDYVNGERYTVTIPSTMKSRVVYYSGTTVVGSTNWKDGTQTYSGSQGGNKVRIMVAYVSDTDITDVNDFVDNVIIQFASSIHATLQSELEVNTYRDSVLSKRQRQGIVLPSFSYGVVNAPTGEIQSSLTRIVSELIPYDNSFFYVKADDSVKTRVFYLSVSEAVVADSGWKNGGALYKASDPNAVSYRICVAYTDDSTISDIYKTASLIEIGNGTATDLENLTTIGIFENFGVIGDSYSRGRYKFSDAVQGYSDYYSWGKIISRKVGNNCLLLGLGGINTRTWLTADISKDGGLAKMLASPAQNLYIMCLGINDTSLGADYIGTDADINDSDYTQNADTFYGNYGRIIQQTMEHAPNAKIVISQLVATNDKSMTDLYNSAIEGIASHFSIPLINPTNDSFFTSSFYLDNKSYGHPTAVTYGGMANAYERLMSACMVENVGYFVDYV